MTSDTQSDLIAQWARAGAAFGATPADESPDLERLLLATARAVSGNARLFYMAITWLCRYGNLVAKYRLKRLIRDELETRYRPALGLLLDMVREQTCSDRFNAAIAFCEQAPAAGPLFDIEQRNPALRKLAQHRASKISRRWNLWAADPQLKYDALRPSSWVMRMNPTYRERAYLKGDLRAAIVEELRRDPDAGRSESELARKCCAQRTALREALDDLELAARIERRTDGNRSRILLCPLEADKSRAVAAPQ